MLPRGGEWKIITFRVCIAANELQQISSFSVLGASEPELSIIPIAMMGVFKKTTMYLWPVYYMLLVQGVTATRRPNIVFILTDDQDVHMHSLEYMPLVQKHLMYEGTTFTRHYCTTALCCPARVSLLTGMLAHNTNVTDIFPPFGEYAVFLPLPLTLR